MFHCVGLWVWLQVPKELKGLRYPHARVAGHSEPPNMCGWNWTLVLLQGQYVLLASKPTLQTSVLFLYLLVSRRVLLSCYNLILTFLLYTCQSPDASLSFCLFPLLQCYLQIYDLTMPLCQWGKLEWGRSCESRALLFASWFWIIGPSIRMMIFRGWRDG